MKVIYAIFVLMLIYAVKANTFGDTKKCTDYTFSSVTTKPAFSLDFCRTTQYDGDGRCCFMKWKEGEKRRYSCVPVSRLELADIDDKISKLQSNSRITEIESLDCQSSYLFVSVLLILSLLL